MRGDHRKQLRRNLARLPSPLAEQVSRAGRRADLQVGSSRSGLLNFGLPEARGRRTPDEPLIRYFHSTYDPVSEATRLAAGIEQDSTVVVLGLGCGHHIDVLLGSAGRVIVVEPDLELVRAAMELIDLPWLADESTVLSWAEPERFAAELAASYRPAIDLSIEVVELSGRTVHQRELFDSYRTTVAATVESLLDDVATQARFGRKWLRNTCANIRGMTPGTLPDFGGRKAVVTAAGPSLEGQVDAIRRLQESDVVIATDTSYPPLLARGINPDVVLTIDCQLASYHHFLTASVPPKTLVADLASPAVISSCAETVIPVLSAHPLHQLVDYLCPGVPHLDSSGGTVTYGAIDLALRGNAEHIALAGGDFSYPGGRLYSRGSYVHQLFDSRAGRICPAELQHYAFLINRPGIHCDEQEPTRYLQPSLLRYRDQVQNLVDHSSAGFTQLPGDGLRVERQRRDGPDDLQVVAPRVWPQRQLSLDLWKSLPERLTSLFRNVKITQSDRKGAEQFTFTALLPYVAYLRGAGASGGPEEILERARDETVEMLTGGST